MSVHSTPVVAAPGGPAHPLKDFWRYFSANKGAIAGLVIVVFVLLVAIFADVLAPYPPSVTDSTAFLLPPAWAVGGSSAHWL
ncbi:MAG: dipeptide ABC transporter permease DppC, partial [Burkholderiales bacterium PBB4]